MTPQEKAKELVAKFSPLVTTWDCYWDAPRDESLILADSKRCALICVEEILDSFKVFMDSRQEFRHSLENESIAYWNEVKTHIEQM